MSDSIIETPLHLHYPLTQCKTPDFCGKTIEKAVAVNKGESFRLYFTDGSLLTISNFIERQQSPYKNIVRLELNAGYAETPRPAGEAGQAKFNQS